MINYTNLLLLTLIQSILLVLGQVTLKFAMLRMEPFSWQSRFWKALLINWQFALCGIFFTAAGLLWAYILKHFPLSQAYPLISLSYVLGMIAAIIFFHEHVDATKWIGVTLIVAGCILIAR